MVDVTAVATLELRGVGDAGVGPLGPRSTASIRIWTHAPCGVPAVPSNRSGKRAIRRCRSVLSCGQDSFVHGNTLRPERSKPDPVLAAIIDRLTVPARVARRYRRITPDTPRAGIADALRTELAGGRVVREASEGSSYLVVQVPRRFRLDIEREVGADGLVAVDLRPAPRP
jgi:hypothetical protein